LWLVPPEPPLSSEPVDQQGGHIVNYHQLRLSQKFCASACKSVGRRA
jgi:hypothetical protein